MNALTQITMHRPYAAIDADVHAAGDLYLSNYRATKQHSHDDYLAMQSKITALRAECRAAVAEYAQRVHAHELIDILLTLEKVDGPAANLLRHFNALAQTAGTDDAEYHADRLVEAARELAADPELALQ